MNEIKVKRIIDGKTYNTETATRIAELDNKNEPRSWESKTWLYQTRYGSFFQVMSVVRFMPDDGEFVTPLSSDEARRWLEENCPDRPELIESLFGETPEAGSGEVKYTLRMPDSLKNRLAGKAEENRQSLNAWMIRCLEGCAPGRKHMTGLAEECLNIINQSDFKFVDAGPLYTPVHGFSLRRDSTLTLILETDIDQNAIASRVRQLPGTVRFTVEQARLTNTTGAETELAGVIPFSLRTGEGNRTDQARIETTQVHTAKVTLRNCSAAAYTIDWLENMPSSPFVWPNSIESIPTSTPWTICFSDNGLAISGDRERQGISFAALRLTISGVTFYVCALGNGVAGGIKPGCIVYEGTPDDHLRKKVRTALSLALGLYLIDLGYTLYDRDWKIVSALARSPYSLWGRAFEMSPEQPAPLGPKYRNELNGNQVTRAVGALVTAYDDLDLGNLSWAYWHACTATPHIAPAHFGAAIEAIQNAYAKSHPSASAKVLMPREAWNALKSKLVNSVDDTDLSAEVKATLTAKLDNLNRADQRQKLKSVLTAIGLNLSDEEDKAWKRRNTAAHGVPIPEGQELVAIRDMKLLKGLFHRMLLRITDAADQYIDYGSTNHPYRNLAEAPPPPLLT